MMKTIEGPVTALYESSPGAEDERAILLAFAEKNPELEPYICYMNGYSREQDREWEKSRTNRPAVYKQGKMVYNSESYSAFPRLMCDVCDGDVKCIVVSSIASFAMGYIDTVYYIQNIFSYLNVRFIAVEDDFDSMREEDMQRLLSGTDRSIRADRSRKLSRLRCEQARKKASQPDAMPPGSAPYGYLVSEKVSESKQYQADPQTAPYVSMMFRWALMGLSCGEIAERMAVLGEPTPGQVRSGQTVEPSGWKSHTVLKILQNPNYTGDIHIGRMQQALYKDEARHNTDTDKWIVRENTHTPLTTRADYEEVQRIIAGNNRRR